MFASFVLRDQPRQAAVEDVLSQPGAPTTPQLLTPSAVPRALRLRPPGSEWLFAKLYGPPTQEDDLLAGPIAAFAEEAVAAGLAKRWFFLRYADPDSYLRLRVQGDPEIMRNRLLPALFSWGAELMAEERCQRFALDTYDREVERYGGPAGVDLAEDIFAADSRAVVQLLQLAQSGALLLDRMTLAILSVDDLLAGLEWSPQERMEWYAGFPQARDTTGDEYRQRKALLRRLLGSGDALHEEQAGPEVAAVFAQRRQSLQPVGRHLRLLAESGELTQPLGSLLSSYIHLHCNRLLGSEAGAETRLLGLLTRTWEGLLRGKQRRN